MDSKESDPSGFKIVTRNYLFNKLREKKAKSFRKKLDILEEEFINDPHFPQEKKEKFIHTFSIFKTKMVSKWEAAHRAYDRFVKNPENEQWLRGTENIPYVNLKPKAGRPTTCFKSASDRSKRRKTETLRSSNDAEELLYAAQMVLRNDGNAAASSVIKNIMTEPEKAMQYQEAFKKSHSDKKMTTTQALSVFVEASLSRKQYNIIREASKDRYPCYSILQKAKQDCYPIRESYRVTETCAEIDLQKLLNHTTQRLVLYLNEVLQTLSLEELASLELHFKWGCDGSKQVQYKQKFENSSDSDANIFQSSLVPLRLTCYLNNKIIWQNPAPSSPRFCRPMRIRFIHETADITKQEISYFNDKINDLVQTHIALEDKEVIVKHTLLLTMVDGKVCNAATETTSTMRCYICKATSKQFNDLSNLNAIATENLQFGLSILHARIRFFESLLHISYKLPIKKWQIRTKEDKAIEKERKETIQHQFRTELGLIVDCPKAQFGNSNDGNTSRRFFANIEKSAQITGINQELMERFAIVLEVISSGHKINLTKFSEYCLDTAKLYVQLYSWHPMSPTVHKILIHGPAVVEHAILPIGALSEEAAEARNKHFRQYREHYARKFSREQNNLDVLNRLLLTSDPYLSSIGKKKQKPLNPFTKTALDMLLPWEGAAIEELNSSQEDSEHQDNEGTDE